MERNPYFLTTKKFYLSLVMTSSWNLSKDYIAEMPVEVRFGCMYCKKKQIKFKPESTYLVVVLG